MVSLSAVELGVDWADMLRPPQGPVRNSSSSTESYTSVLSDSLSGSLSSSLAELPCIAAPARSDASSPHSAAAAAAAASHAVLQQWQRPLHTLQVQPPPLQQQQQGKPLALVLPAAAVGELAAPVPSQVRDSQNVARLLRASSSHFDALDGASPVRLPSAPAMAASGASSCAPHPGSPAGSPERGMPSSTTSGGPPPDVLLAALSASLAARQERQQEQRQGQGQQLEQRQPCRADLGCAAAEAAAPVLAAAAAPSATAAAATAGGFACTSCSIVFADAAAFRAHCTTVEHAMAVVSSSLVMGVPGVAAQAAGLASGTLASSAAGQQLWPPATSQSLLAPHTAPTALSCNTSALLAGLSGGQAASQASLPAVLHGASGISAGAAAYGVPAHSLAPSNPTAPFCLTSCCNQVIDPQLDLVVHSLLKQLRQLDGVERAVGVHVPRGPGGSKALRRLVGGLREVRKAVRSGTAAAVVAAVDIQETNPCAAARRCCSAQPGADIAEICQLAALCGVPVVFALTRLGLGSIFGTNKRMSAVALTNVTGVEVPLQQMLRMAEVGRARFAHMVALANGVAA